MLKALKRSRPPMSIITMLVTMIMIPSTTWAASGSGAHIDMTHSWVGYFSLFLFVVAYALVILEHNIHMRKSKPVMVVAGVIWAMVAYVYAQKGDHHTAEHAIRHNILEYAELLLFLLAAMTYINTMEERQVFNKLRVYLVNLGLSLRAIFWVTGVLAFFISPIADNLTTALLMSAVAMAVGGKNIKIVTLACINIVVAANAGGAFSPFGDITTLMVWQKGLISFSEFFAIFVPSVVNWLVPAAIMAFTIGSGKPEQVDEDVQIKDGGLTVVFLFIGTIATAVSFHNFLYLPPTVGMMTGLGVLMLFGYYLKIKNGGLNHAHAEDGAESFDIFKQLERSEWDTLMFFYGIILCVGGLGQIGYLAVGSQMLYVDLGPTVANTIVGIASAIVDNIPVMFAVLTELPAMDHGQWLLVTLTAGVGGSLLSIGSAAGVALMGQARGVYTFFAHLRWTWAIALGYFASIGVHLWWNADLFDGKNLTLPGQETAQVEQAEPEAKKEIVIETPKAAPTDAPAATEATEGAAIQKAVPGNNAPVAPNIEGAAPEPKTAPPSPVTEPGKVPQPNGNQKAVEQATPPGTNK